MVSPNDLNSTENTESNKRIAKPLFVFYNNGKCAFTTIEAEIIDKLGLTRRDRFTQEVQGENILLRRFKE